MKPAKKAIQATTAARMKMPQNKTRKVTDQTKERGATMIAVQNKYEKLRKMGTARRTEQ